VERLRLNSPTQSPTSRHRLDLLHPKGIAATIVGIGGPCAVFEIRGLCWEALLGSVVIFAIALLVVRPPLSVWLAAVLVVGLFGSVGLIGWSGWRFHSLNVFSSYSPRLTICGRDYQPEGSVQRRLPAPFENLAQHVMGVTPSGSAILDTGCQTTVLFVKSPGPTYRPYDLLGGP
jgi:hypothetical protein